MTFTVFFHRGLVSSYLSTLDVGQLRFLIIAGTTETPAMKVALQVILLFSLFVGELLALVS